MSKNPATKKTPYSGELAKPIVEPPHPLGFLREDIAEWSAAQRQIAKLPELFRHFGIDPAEKHCWSKLAVALAIKHVPGMRVSYAAKSKGGRPPTWIAGQDEELFRDAEEVRQQLSIGFEEAIRRLQIIKSEKWGRFSFENLNARYGEVRRKKEALQNAQTLLGPEYEAVVEAFGPVPSTNENP
jgi:hypothetical protein